ncbi:MAG: ATP-binding protein [Spirochaetaceae bacterium]|nr:ATP-binding protein [Spirochaetaceae bacterium]
MTAAPQRLFAPGDGATPPALTGREREEAVLTRCLADLLAGTSPPHDVVLTGPRGNGKTVLLNWFEHACRDHGTDVDVVNLTPDDIPTRDALIDVLSPRGIARLLSRESTLGAKLTARCRKKPFAVLLDEAHTLDPGVGRVLLNASQQVRANAPFLLALAGTPGLAAHLGAMGVSFWSRLGEGRLGIGLLSDAAARAALVEPLAAHGTSLDADALNAVIDDSQRYPYFIQVWGRALWQQRLAIGATRLTAVHVDAARPDVAGQITDYYQERYRELETRGLLPAAVATAPLFQAGADATASDHAIDAALAATGTDAAARLAAREELHRLGYLWSPPGQLPPVVWIAGIPSLTAYVLANAPPLGVRKTDDGDAGG